MRAPSRQVLAFTGIFALALATGAMTWASVRNTHRQCGEPSPYSVETLFAPCVARSQQLPFDVDATGSIASKPR
jgi:hypothetical protein